MASGGMRMVREALETVLTPAMTSAVLFQALSRAEQEVPRSMEDLRTLVRGPLTETLVRRVGERDAASIIARIEAALAEHAKEEASAAWAGGGQASRRDRDNTTTVPLTRASVVLVVGAGRSLAARLLAALGPERVTPTAVWELEDVRQLPMAPALVLIDARSFAAIEPWHLVEALGHLPSTTVHVVWGPELPYGRSVLSAMKKQELGSVALDPEEGIEPLLDLIRSRHTG